MTTQTIITQEDLLILINKYDSYNIDLKINGEYYKPSNIKAIANAFKSGYNDTITLKINGEINVLNGVLI